MSATSASFTAADPIELLRKYTTKKRPVEMLDANGNLTKELVQAVTIRFGEEASFPRDVLTSYSRSNSDADHYMLSALMLSFAHEAKSYYEYMKIIKSTGLQSVSFTDRAVLNDYISGKTDSLVSADASAAAGSAGAADSAAASNSTGGKRANSDAAGEGGRSRTRLDPNGSFSRTKDATREVVRRERVLITTSNVMGSTKSFARVSVIIKEMFAKNKDADGKPTSSSAARPAAGTSASAASAANGRKSSSHRRASQRKRANPIIIVPSAAVAMVNMYNVEELLKNHHFIDSKVIREKGEPKPREIFVEHTLSRREQRLRFRIVDSVDDFTEADWNSVVCVFALGEGWQFKNWIWGTPEAIFQNTLGFHPKYVDVKPKDTMKTWGVSMLNIERTQRHMDTAAVTGLWSSIERYMATKKPEFFN
ncbi:accessory factor associated with RNA polymerase II [Coemansia interrupta]|uniref:Accessory factor associated with RNA polymerase II n=1 Tax=Coemansia interrupta TaxID=1126814 RepID=A0A9W8H4K8_9FUNG|nr:accessory factor associated with RNA polymerase II [Coemansia interrupta]